MVNIQKAITAGIKYTKNGCRLLGKTALKDGSVQIAEVETHFGKGKTIIKSFFENGVINKQIIQKFIDGKSVSETIQNFLHKDETFVIKSVNKQGKKILSDTTDSFFKRAKNTFSRLKFSVIPQADGSRQEMQLYANLSPGKKSSFIETSAKRLNDGSLTDKKFITNINRESIIAELRNDPFFYIRSYQIPDFLESASHIVAKMNKVPRGIFSVVNHSPFYRKIFGDYSGAYNPVFNFVEINIGRVVNKADAVNTISHEYRHKYQRSILNRHIKSLFNFLRPKSKRIVLSAPEKVKEDLFLKAEKKYPYFFGNHEKYYNNFLEVDARQSGSIAEDIFNKGQYVISYLFGFTQK